MYINNNIVYAIDKFSLTQIFQEYHTKIILMKTYSLLIMHTKTKIAIIKTKIKISIYYNSNKRFIIVETCIVIIIPKFYFIF